jgi:hypothetical protein
MTEEVKAVKTKEAIKAASITTQSPLRRLMAKSSPVIVSD